MAKTSKHAPGSGGGASVAAAAAAATAATVVAGALCSLEVTEAERTPTPTPPGLLNTTTTTATTTAAGWSESLDFDDALASFASSEIFRMCEGAGDFGAVVGGEHSAHGVGGGGVNNKVEGGGGGGMGMDHHDHVDDMSPELMEAVCGGVTGDCLAGLHGVMDFDDQGGGAGLKTTTMERDGGGGRGGGGGGGAGGGLESSGVSAASGQTRDDAGFVVASFGGGGGGTEQPGGGFHQQQHAGTGEGAGGVGGVASMSVVDSLLSDSAFCKDFAASLPHGDAFGLEAGIFFSPIFTTTVLLTPQFIRLE